MPIPTKASPTRADSPPNSTSHVESGVCWLLGYTSEHDYRLFEDRAANNDLLPDIRDETLLELEREQLDFAVRVGPGLRALIRAAVESPAVPRRGWVGALLRLEVTVIIVPIDDSVLADLFISIALPLHAGETSQPPDWPGSNLQERLIELALGTQPDDWEIPPRFPPMVATIGRPTLRESCRSPSGMLIQPASTEARRVLACC